MNLKYYLRGLGIGIVVSTLIVGIATGNKTKTLSDEEIKQRARELGMVETSGTLAEEVQVPVKEDTYAKEETSANTLAVPTEESKEVETTPAVTKKPEAEPTTTPTEKPEEAEPTATPTDKPEEAEPTATPTEKPEAKPTAEKMESTLAESDETITIVVKSGSGSYSICKQLEDAGLVESASEYDTYLYQKGYDKRIVAAAHEIPIGADKEQIALILTGKK